MTGERPLCVSKGNTLDSLASILSCTRQKLCYTTMFKIHTNTTESDRPAPLSKSLKILFLINTSIIWIYLMSPVHLSGRPSILRSKNFNRHYMQTIQSYSFIPATLMCTIEWLTSTILYALLFTLTLPGVTRSLQSKTYWVHFLPHFSSDQDEI